jgi:mono/diheme cytochrome c family protein
MISPVRRIAVMLSALLLSSAIFVMGQESKTQVKKVPITKTSATSGAEMFKSYCAACHGADAKGNGPATPGLKVPPPDLTTLAKRHDGKYPDAYVITVLHHGAAPIHGSADMPIWGPVFGSVGLQGQDSGEVALRISNLNGYLESLQSK